jgi:uncharacterized membrane protein
MIASGKSGREAAVARAGKRWRMQLTRAAAALTLLAVWVTATGAQDGGPMPPRAASADWLDMGLHWITRLIEIGGIAIIVVAAFAATARYLRTRSSGPELAYHQYRVSLGRAILLGLELLVAADIIGTVAIEPTMNSVAVLAGIVLIRTFLSISLEVEIEGRWPWRRAQAEPGGWQA